MPLTIEQEERFQHLTEVVQDQYKTLNPWERGFFDDQVKRYAEYGAKLNLSPKQWSVLDKMYEKCTEVK